MLLRPKEQILVRFRVGVMDLMQTPITHVPSKFEKRVQEGVLWIRTHREQFWAITGTIAGVVLVLSFMIQRRETENKEAWTQLGVAQGYLLQNQRDQASKALDQWSTRFKSTSADAYAKFLRADLLYNATNYAGAAQIYGELAAQGKPIEIRPLALSAQSASEEMAGRLPEALALAQQFNERYPEHFLAASMFYSQARLSELTGNASGASALYDRFVILYPQSPWTQFARARLQALAVPASAPRPRQ